MKHTLLTILLCVLTLSAIPAEAARANLAEEAEAAMKKACSYLIDEVSCNGGFVWYYLPDFSRRWGELEATPTMIWLQEPGTAGVGNMLLDAYEATGDEFYYSAAEKVGAALIHAQLDCGGWNYVYDFSGRDSLIRWYDTVGASAWRLEEFQEFMDNATFDDGCTVCCTRMLLRLYQEKLDPKYRPAIDKALDFVLESQYPSGGWPQRWPLRNNYSSCITLNDSVTQDAAALMLEAYGIFGDKRYRESAMRAMYLTILLQQGQPYAGWSDQYSVEDLRPAAARTYEPRSVNPATTVSMIRQMMEYYRLTGDTRFLSGIPAAIGFLESLRLPESEVERWGRTSDDPEAFLVPRFICPETGEPMYIHRRGSNSYNGRYYSDDDISGTIRHYSSAVWVNTAQLRREYEAVLAGKAEIPANEPGPVSEAEVKKIISELDGDGRWLTPLTNTSNPYLPCPVTGPSDETAYCATNAGDRYDTSPYRLDEPVPGISVREYMRRIGLLTVFIKENKDK